tara:strand:+ start:46 stop:258 length:213 start_codon:yes stop_codon:yes gene_type:complete
MMDAGDYLLIDGMSLKIRQVIGSVVYLETGARLDMDEAKRYKCSSGRAQSVCVKSRNVGITHKMKQLGLL